MPKTHSNCRLVLRDRNGRIIADQEYRTFAIAEPHYSARSKGVPDGCVLTLQHGARIIRTAWGRDANRAIFDGAGDPPKREEVWNPVSSADTSLQSQAAALRAVIDGQAAKLTGRHRTLHIEHLKAALVSLNWIQQHEAVIRAAIDREE